MEHMGYTPEQQCWARLEDAIYSHPVYDHYAATLAMHGFKNAATKKYREAEYKPFPLPYSLQSDLQFRPDEMPRYSIGLPYIPRPDSFR